MKDNKISRDSTFCSGSQNVLHGYPPHHPAPLSYTVIQNEQYFQQMVTYGLKSTQG
jgi:hypothetical protein